MMCIRGDYIASRYVYTVTVNNIYMSITCQQVQCSSVPHKEVKNNFFGSTAHCVDGQTLNELR